MHIIYCDGSTKPSGQVVISLVLATIARDRVEKIIYCYKEVFEPSNFKSIHELLALFTALTFVKDFHLEKCLIVNDSYADTITVKNYIKTHTHNERLSHPSLQDMIQRLEGFSYEQVSFKILPRTTLGINVADFLNRETHAWVREKDKLSLETNMRKMINRPIDYNLSSKSRDMPLKIEKENRN